ncbi:MAG: TIGR02266 family protein [Deltaproteobacteria bacterium]|nr:TIGR02266 family protein [Deltaproteobacteria bacterium]
MTHPAQTAREYLMKALEATQRDPALESELGRLTPILAKAQGLLFQATKEAPDSFECGGILKGAMEHLAQALQIFQDVQTGGPAVQEASSSVAKTLALLFPIVQDAKKRFTAEKERISQLPPEQRPASVAPPPTAGAFAGQHVPARTINWNVLQQLTLDSETQFYTGFSQNLDEGGLFVATFDVKPIGAKVLLTFELPGGRQITAKGRVMWVREYDPKASEVTPGMGLKFLQLRDDDRRLIEGFLKRRVPMFFDQE